MAASRFSASVWALARRVPPGRATTYGLLAEAHFGVAKGARGVGQAMALTDCDAHDLAPDRALLDVFGVGRQRGEREIAVAVTEECVDVAAEDLVGLDLEPRILLVDSCEQ